jgi:predicted TIM-barrel fold metal-dependent hydrolase
LSTAAVPADEIARSFPKLKIVIGQLGHPWTEETITMLGKHPNVFADISGLLTRRGRRTTSSSTSTSTA